MALEGAAPRPAGALQPPEVASQARGRPLASAASLLFTGQSGPVVPADTSAPPGYLLEPDDACPGYQSAIASRTQTEDLDAILKDSCPSRPNLLGHEDDVNRLELL